MSLATKYVNQEMGEFIGDVREYLQNLVSNEDFPSDGLIIYPEFLEAVIDIVEEEGKELGITNNEVERTFFLKRPKCVYLENEKGQISELRMYPDAFIIRNFV